MEKVLRPVRLDLDVNAPDETMETLEKWTLFQDSRSGVVLKGLSCKIPNEIFTCHYSATRHQKSGESIDQFLVALKRLSKDCNFQTVTAEVYRDELTRDSFISGLSSTYIRQRLFEHKTLTQEEAYRYAVALESAQKNSSAYTPTQLIATV